jgi:hypothetical protein
MSNYVDFLNGPGNWFAILCGLSIPILIVLCFNFTLTFFEFLRKGDERLIAQYKSAATICLFLVFFIPIFYSIYNMLKLKGY